MADNCEPADPPAGNISNRLRNLIEVSLGRVVLAQQWKASLKVLVQPLGESDVDVVVLA